MAKARSGTSPVPSGATLLLFLLLSATPIWAQSRPGRLAGFVVDAAGEPLPGVTVTLRSEKQGIRDRGTITDERGLFDFLQLPPSDDYVLRAELAGHATVEMRVEVQGGRRTVETITLRSDLDLRQEVEVIGRGEVVDPEEPQTTTRFRAEFIEGLPVIGRDYEDVLVLAPGVQDENQDGNVNILGSRDRDVMTMVDGVDVTDPFTGKDPMAFNLEAIAEIELIRAGAGAQYGGKSGGFVNLITKSGSNQFEGSFKLFLRGDFLDGDGAGSDPPELHGGDGSAQTLGEVEFNEFRPFLSLGGPILRDRLWYYIANEYLSIETPVNTVNRAFATSFEGFREFGKLTWQAAASNKAELVFVYDPFQQGNLGVDSSALVEAGYTRERQRTSWTLRDYAILSPRVLLESRLSVVDYGFDDIPTTDPDRNGNRIFYRRPALPDHQDLDCTIADPSLCDSVLDRDGDGYITDLEDPDGFFPPRWRDPGEDFNDDGILNEKICLPLEVAGRRFCEGDHNGDAIAVPRDVDYRHETVFNVKSGPYPLTSTDGRERIALSEMLSIEVDDFFGTHSVDLGGGIEGENYRTDIERRTVMVAQMNGGCLLAEQATTAFEKAQFLSTAECQVDAQIPLPRIARDLEAETDRVSLFANDRYKPLPNLTLGLGVRFDREAIDASGFRPFDPVRERQIFDRVGRQIAGRPALLDLDPILSTGKALGRIQKMRHAALRVFTAHENPPAFDLPSIYTEIRDQVTDALDPNPRVREPFSIENNNLSPRLSIAWDPRGDGRTKFYSTWGRYYDNIFLEAVVQEEAPATVTRSYIYDYNGLADDNCDPTDPATLRCEYHGIFESDKLGAFSPPSIRQVSRGLASPHADEFTVGFEMEVAPEFALGVSYIRRKWSDQLQDVDINHRATDQDLLGSLTRVKLPDPDGTCGGGPLDLPDEDGLCRLEGVRVPDGIPDLNVENFFFNQVLKIGNFNSSDYEGIELTLRRRLHRRWQMEGSYTYSEVVGAAKDFASELGNDPANTEEEFGRLDFDQTHVVKLSALTHLPKDFVLAGIATWSSGYPFSEIYERTSFDSAGYSQFRRIYPSGRRNDRSNDSFFSLSTSLAKGFVIGRVAGRFRLDVENLLNSDDLRVFTSNDFALANQLLAERRFGRRYELGLEFHF